MLKKLKEKRGFERYEGEYCKWWVNFALKVYTVWDSFVQQTLTLWDQPTAVISTIWSRQRDESVPFHYFFPLPFSSVIYKYGIPYLVLTDTPISVSVSIIPTTVYALAHRPHIQNPHYARPLSDVTKTVMAHISKDGREAVATKKKMKRNIPAKMMRAKSSRRSILLSFTSIIRPASPAPSRPLLPTPYRRPPSIPISCCLMPPSSFEVLKQGSKEPGAES